MKRLRFLVIMGKRRRIFWVFDHFVGLTLKGLKMAWLQPAWKFLTFSLLFPINEKSSGTEELFIKILLLYHLVSYITWLDATLDDLQTRPLRQILFYLRDKLSGLKITNCFHWVQLKDSIPERWKFIIKDNCEIVTNLIIHDYHLRFFSYNFR